MKTTLIATLLICLPLFAACDDGEPAGSEYNGFYQVTLSQERTSCSDQDAWTPSDIMEPYFKLKAQSLFGTPIVGWISCTGETEDTCDDETIDLMGIFVKKDGTWQQYMTTSSSGGGETICYLTYRQGIPALTESGLSITVTRWEGEITLEAGEECDPDLVDKYFDQMDCTQMEYLEATRL
ncbi:hypothetical protein KKD52_18690 [Myxococcota bacterium]|nr:hypothetical protein [Myxococcota bacterium]